MKPHRALALGVALLVAVPLLAPPPAAAQPMPLDEVGTIGPGAGELSDPFGLAFDSAGNLYVSERNNHRISAFSPDGTFLRAFGYDVALPANPGAEVFEVCTTMTGCKAGYAGIAPDHPGGQLHSPYGIAIDGSDRLFVADTNSARISVFNVAGGSSSFLHAFEM